MPTTRMRVLLTASLHMLLALLLSGCGCVDKKYPEEQHTRFRDEGVSLVGESEQFRIQIKYIRCKVADDGLLGGSEEEPTFTLACDGKTDSYSGSFKTGQVIDYNGFGRNTDETCFYGGIMTVTCARGSAVTVSIKEEDDFSSAETGSVTIPGDMLGFMYHGMQMTFSISLQSKGSWDTFWNGALDLIGGICLTDLIPGGKAAKGLKMSAKAVKRIKKANKVVKRYTKAQSKLAACSDAGVEACGDAADVMDALWNAQCINADPGGGTYAITMQVSGCVPTTLGLAGLAVLLMVAIN